MSRRLLALVASVLVLLGLVPSARAAEAVRVVVRDLPGDETPSVKNALVRVLLAQKSVELLQSAYFDKVAERLGVSAKEAKGVKQAARALGVAVIVDGSVDDTETGMTATLRVRGSDGEALETQELTEKTRRELARRVGELGWKWLAPAIADAEPPAAAKKRRLVLLELGGSGAPALRAAMEKALSKAGTLELVPEAEAKAARPEDAPGPADRVLVAAALGATALLKGSATQSQLSLNVQSGKNSDDIGEVKLKGFGVAGLKRAIDAELVKKLEPILAEALPPVPPREELEEEPLEPEALAPKAEGPRPSPLEAQLSLRGGTRNYRYSDDLFGALRAYKMGVTPAVAVTARWYPAAHFEGGVVAHVGITASYEQAFLIESKAGGEAYDTRSREWQLGLHGRVPLDALELGVDVGLGEHTFEVDDDPNLPLVPDVSYRFVRGGVEARYRTGKLLVGGSFGYRHVTDAGAIATAAWFPRLEVAGLDAGAFAGHAVLPTLHVLGGVLYRRYWYSLNPEPGDPRVAGGALDSFISGWVGVGFTLPAKGEP